MRILAGKYKGKSLKTFSNPHIRPTSGLVKEAFFSICREDIEGAAFLDLFAGMGAIGFEALSRGAACVVFVDISIKAIQLIHTNSALLGEQLPVVIFRQDAQSAIQRLIKQKRSFDLIYIDPPYELCNRYVQTLLQKIVSGNILNPEGTLFLENASDEEIACEGLTLRRRRKLGKTYLAEYIVEKDP
ncbi:putative methyltransferase [Chlamydia pneumoniae LPCoLN]|uniref:16S rRNA (guanine(966)-N(2))-methyltransferase RsmD n=1 Tax=Chlamydia pneumoniae TaxID=83558 RepID=UPI0001BD9DF6|nr:16S rRNA (guanine(966)-N(2))-methyltransferase RsmD [Chlamydia pneumoniae]ACZ32488.1 putative methyltransferase [Chlamydia pneumoniae LPCoLN]ETR80514.1 16S rRNA (guanine(966)-N(2))-methyltransferase [Chlamydia pneumoniae B21]